MFKRRGSRVDNLVKDEFFVCAAPPAWFVPGTLRS
jgi:hypothetical protein